jgi:hypothetical protein
LACKTFSIEFYGDFNMSFACFANNVSTNIAATVAPSDTTISLISAAGIVVPTGAFIPITLLDIATRRNIEIVYITAVAGNSVTVIRGQDDTTAQAWSIGDIAYSTNTKGNTAGFNGNPNNQFQVADAFAANQAVALGQFNSLKQPAGWMKRPDGMILQWGNVSVGNNQTLTVTLPILFPTNILQAFATMRNPGNNSSLISGTPLSSSQIQVVNIQIQNTPIGRTCNAAWWAIGH